MCAHCPGLAAPVIVPQHSFAHILPTRSNVELFRAERSSVKVVK